MSRLSTNQRSFIADKLMDSANYALAGLVFGQLVVSDFRGLLLFMGISIYFGGWMVSVQLKKGDI